MSDIFISYTREDRAKVEPLARALEMQGWSVWWDRHILAGTDYDSVIEEAIDSARCIIVAWSSRSVASNWVRAEAGEGADRRILIPVFLEEVRVPLAFRRIQTVSLVGWNGDMSHPDFDRLIQAASKLLRKSPPTDREGAPFQTGDIIEQYRYLDENDFKSGPEESMKGTKWRVLRITPEHIRLELVEGRYYDDPANTDVFEGPGLVDDFASSVLYLEKFPNAKKTQQIFDEFRRVKRGRKKA